MFKTQRMVKAGIVCPNNLLDKIVSRLYELKVIQIEEYEKEKDNNSFDLGHPLKKGEELSELLIKLRSIASHSGITLKKQELSKKDKNGFDEIRVAINTIHESLKNKIEKIEYYKKAGPAIKKREYKSALEGIKVDSPRAKDKDSIMFAGLVRKNVEKDIKLISETSFVASKDVDGTKLMLILAPKAKKTEIQAVLEENFYLSINSKDIRLSHSQVTSELIESKTRSEELTRLLAKTEKELADELQKIRTLNEPLLQKANQKLEEELKKCDVPVKFAASKNTHIISGWMPEAKFEKIKQTLENETDQKVFVHLIPLKENEEGPILLKNPRPASSFHYLLDLFTLPSYREFDPTLLMFITFPLFFGFMLGDMGYGLVSLIFFALLRMKFKEGAMKEIINILIISSIATIAFGAVFGEVFGEEELFGHEIPHLIGRVAHINEVLMIAILIGVVHLNLGLLIGFYNVWKHHGFMHAILEKTGLIILQIGAVLAYLGFTNKVGFSGYVGIGVIGASALILYLGEGMKGILEMPSIFGNILSYARLMAVGLASVELALIVNEMAKELFHKGIIGIIGGILVLIIGHLINFGLGLLGPFLHSLRLHYVEFFGKFYTGGGKKFTPFGENN